MTGKDITKMLSLNLLIIMFSIVSVTFDIYSFNFSFTMHFKMLKMMNDAPESQMITILTALMA